MAYRGAHYHIFALMTKTAFEQRAQSRRIQQPPAPHCSMFSEEGEGVSFPLSPCIVCGRASKVRRCLRGRISDLIAQRRKDHLVTLRVNADGVAILKLALQYFYSEWIQHKALDGAFQRAGTKSRIVPFLHEQPFRLFR